MYIIRVYNSCGTYCAKRSLHQRKAVVSGQKSGGGGRGGKIQQPLPTQIHHRRVIGVICPRGNKSNGQFIKRQQCPFSSFSSRVWPRRPVTRRVRLSHFSSFLYNFASDKCYIQTVSAVPRSFGFFPHRNSTPTALLSRSQTSPLPNRWDARIKQWTNYATSFHFCS